jgi:hypothetical protein
MIKVIETSYKGYRFRSRSEARWAVFFDALGYAWEYEPEGYDLGGSQGYYLPDFRVWSGDSVGLGVPQWIEVKGPAPTQREIELITAVSRMTGIGGAIVYGEIEALPVRPNTFDLFGSDPPYERLDHWTVPAYVVDYGRTGWPFCRNYDVQGGWRESDPARMVLPDMCAARGDLVLGAVRAARSARFEHGESGAPVARPWPPDGETIDFSDIPGPRGSR